jgi:deazaflavin-dependent oxidoreductase (nitroreductase family)
MSGLFPRISRIHQYVHDGDDYLVVASSGGRAKPPTWLANLKTHPDCEIQVGRARHRVIARPTLPDERGYARRWTITDTNNKRSTRR